MENMAGNWEPFVLTSLKASDFSQFYTKKPHLLKLHKRSKEARRKFYIWNYYKNTEFLFL